MRIVRPTPARAAAAPPDGAAAASSTTTTTTTELEDQLLAMLRSEAAYAPSTCVVHSCPLSVMRRSSSTPVSSPGGVAGLVGMGGGVGGMMVGADGAVPVPHDEWRARIADWSYRVVDHFQYDREVVSVSMNFFDRFLVLTRAEHAEKGGKSEDAVDSRTYQLAAMTALFLSVKLHGEQPDDDDDDDEYDREYADGSTASAAAGAVVTPTAKPSKRKKRRRRLRLASFVELSRGQFSIRDISAMENRMLRTLRWRVNPPTPMVFVSYLLRLFPSAPPDRARGPEYAKLTAGQREDVRDEERRRHDLVLHVIHELSRYLTELSVCLPDVSAVHSPSRLAYAAVLISTDAMTRAALGGRVRREFVRSASALSPGLRPDDPEIVSLKVRMRTSFLPELLLEGGGDGGDASTSLSSSSSSSSASSHASHVGGGHPIAIARDAGLLDVTSLCGSPPPGDDAHDRDVDRRGGGGAGGGCSGHIRKGSARGVIDEASESIDERGRARNEFGAFAEEQDSPVCVSRHSVGGLDGGSGAGSGSGSARVVRTVQASYDL